MKPSLPIDRRRSTRHRQWFGIRLAAFLSSLGYLIS
jgi:hypothetical protein